MKKRQTLSPVTALFDNEQVRRATNEDGELLYAAVDVVRALVETEHPEEYWNDVKRHAPHIESCVEVIQFGDGEPEVEALTRQDVLRMVLAISSPKADKIKLWLAEAGQQRIEEAENPELVLLRTRDLYQRKGYHRRWIDKRLRGISTRHELTSEWARRGLTDSEEYRALTNEIMQAAFGMDVEAYRRYKNLTGSGQNLRDHMTDLELVLTMLGESTAAALARDRDAHGFEQLAETARGAGEVVAATREAFEHRSGRPVVHTGAPYRRHVA